MQGHNSRKVPAYRVGYFEASHQGIDVAEGTLWGAHLAAACDRLCLAAIGAGLEAMYGQGSAVIGTSEVEFEVPADARISGGPSLVGRLFHGHFADFVRDRHAFMLNAHAHAARHGDVIRLRIGHRPVYLFNSPESIEEVLVTRSAELERREPGNEC